VNEKQKIGPLKKSGKQETVSLSREEEPGDEPSVLGSAFRLCCDENGQELVA
jgi:hypothetical protein